MKLKLIAMMFVVSMPAFSAGNADLSLREPEAQEEQAVIVEEAIAIVEPAAPVEADVAKGQAGEILATAEDCVHENSSPDFLAKEERVQKKAEKREVASNVPEATSAKL